MVSELVEKYNALLRLHQLFIEFVHDKQLGDELLEYLKHKGLESDSFS